MDYTGTSLVTGATGFVGRHVVAHLRSHGVRVRAAALPKDDTRELESLGAEIVRADLTLPDTLPPLFAGDVDRVFHLGAICNLSTPYRVLHAVNVAGVERITALAVGAAVRTFVHMSSTSVYGPYRGIPFVESAPCLPQDDYGRSKRDGENVVWQRMREGLPAVILRPCTVYGPGCGDGAGKVFSRPSRLGAIPGDGAARLSNVRVEDVAAAAYYLSTRDDAVGEAFNIADCSHPTIKHALQLAAEAYQTPMPRMHVPLPIVSAFAYARGAVARLTRRIPDLEPDAVRYLYDDYLVSNAKLLTTGYRFLYPDFAESMHELGDRRSARTRTAI